MSATEEFLSSEIGSRSRRAAVWLDRLLARQKDSLILWTPVCFGTGIAVYFSLRQEPPPWLSVALLTVTTATAVTAWVLRKKREIFYIAWLLAFAACLAAGGFADAQLRTLTRHTVMLKRPLGAAKIEATVEEDNVLAPGAGAQLLLGDIKIAGLAVSQTPQRLRLRIRGVAAPQPGDRVAALAGLTPPAPPNAPGAFDFQRYAWFRGIGGFGFAYRPPEILQAKKPGTAALWLAGTRAAIIRRLDASIPYPEAAIAETLAVGTRAAIRPADEEAMRAAGLSHMLVIAGLHIGLVGGIVFFVARFLMALFPTFALYHPIKKYAAVAAFFVAFAYAILAGASVPTMRAVLMSGVVLLAELTDRVAFSPRLIALAALTILLMLPEALIGPSFQLSFAAVTALIVVYDRLRPAWTRWYGEGNAIRRIGLYFAAIGLTTIIASTATAPYAIYQFQNFTPYGVLGNLLAIPVLSWLTMPCLLLGGLLMPLHLERAPLALAGHGIHFILAIAHRVAALPQATLPVATMPTAVLVLITLAGAIGLFWRGRGALVALLPALAAAILLTTHRPPDILVSADARLLAVRDGDAYLLSSRVSDRYAGRDWLQSLGDAPGTATRWPTEGRMMQDAMVCAEGGCRWQAGGRKIAFSFSPWTQIADCAWADTLIAQQPLFVRRCNASTVIDRFTIWRGGAVALWLGGKVESVNDERGQRPWCIVNQTRSSATRPSTSSDTTASD